VAFSNNKSAVRQAVPHLQIFVSSAVRFASVENLAFSKLNVLLRELLFPRVLDSSPAVTNSAADLKDNITIPARSSALLPADEKSTPYICG
jgi:hypothetical protein